MSIFTTWYTLSFSSTKFASEKIHFGLALVLTPTKVLIQRLIVYLRFCSIFQWQADLDIWF